ncbi:MAG: hypothetical protein Fur0020_00280 [Thermodesulfovibrionia bacterium]
MKDITIKPSKGTANHTMGIDSAFLFIKNGIKRINNMSNAKLLNCFSAIDIIMLETRIG